MDTLSVILGCILLAVVVVYVIHRRKSSRCNGLPPGPPGKPFVGNTFDVDTADIHISLSELGAGYGDIFSLRICGRNVVVLQTIEAFREFFESPIISDSVSEREANFQSIYVTEGKDIPTSLYTRDFKQRRAVLHCAAKRFENVQARWAEEISQLVEVIGSKAKTPQDLEQPIAFFLTNLALVMTIGQRFDPDDPRLLMLVERNSLLNSLHLPGVNAILTLFPSLRHLAMGYGKQYQRLQFLTQKLKEVIFDTEKASFNPNAIRGGLDELLQLQQNCVDKKDSELTDDHIWRSVLSLTSGASGSEVGELLYFFIVVIRQPDICLRIQREVDSVVGKHRLPTLADRGRMPYTEAAILELHRWVTPMPVLLPRCTAADIQFRKYSIPKQTTIVANAWEIHHNKTFWTDPWKFRPDRFLDQSGGLLPPESAERHRLIPFGIGNRKCIGAEMANAASFLVITSILQRFIFETPPKRVPAPDPHFHRDGIPTLRPRPFKVILKPRPV